MTINILNQFFQHSGLSPNELESVLPDYERVEFRKGDLFLQEGQQANQLMLVESGLLRAYVIDPKGQDITTSFFATESVVIEVASFFLRVPTREYIEAITDGVGWRISFQNFQKHFHGIERYREFARSKLVQQFFDLKMRSLSMIADSAQQRYEDLVRDHPAVMKEAPLKYIASYLGITDSSLSRIRHEVTKGSKKA